MDPRPHILTYLSAQGVVEHAPIWDVQLAPRGLTVTLEDGRVCACKLDRKVAEALAHSWSVVGVDA